MVLSVDEHTVTLERALAETRTGDIWLFRGRSGPDRAIQTLSNSPVNHVGMTVALDDLPPLAQLQAMGDFNLQLDLAGTPSAVEASHAVDEAAPEPEPMSVDDDSADEEEASTAPQATGELVAAPPRYED